MYGKINNNLLVIEDDNLDVYELDHKAAWEVGRPSPAAVPDIRLYTATVSRRHGKFQNMDGVWFYLDYNGKNGTAYNGKKITSGLRGRTKPLLLTDGDILVFGGSADTVPGPGSVWAMYLQQRFAGDWHAADTMGFRGITVITSTGRLQYEKPERGMIVKQEDGMLLYLGDVAYMAGNISVEEMR